MDGKGDFFQFKKKEKKVNTMLNYVSKKVPSINKVDSSDVKEEKSIKKRKSVAEESIDSMSDEDFIDLDKNEVIVTKKQKNN